MATNSVDLSVSSYPAGYQLYALNETLKTCEWTAAWTFCNIWFDADLRAH